MAKAEEGASWIYKNKGNGVLSTAASLGLSHLWNSDDGLADTDKHTYSADESVKAGAYLAIGLLHSNIQSESDAPFAMLSEHVNDPSEKVRISAIVGLGFAYAGMRRQDIWELLNPILSDETISMEIAAACALSLGYIFVSSAHGEITSTILQTMMERDEKQLSDKWSRYMTLGLGLLYLGRQDASDAIIETLKAIPHPISKAAVVLVDVCAWTGTSNVLKIQSMLHNCAEHIVQKNPDDDDDDMDGPAKAAAAESSESKKEEEDKASEENKDDTFQIFSVLGISMIAMGEEVGAEMSLRHFNHLVGRFCG